MQGKLKREPDFSQFLKVLRREGRPKYLPFYEHIASPEFIAARMETPFDKMIPGSDEYIRTYIDFWLGMGYGIDAKHSFEDKILPAAEFKKKYGRKITPLGGLDVDFICRQTKEEIRRYTIGHIETCFADGYWALGTGNSLTGYMPVENYLTVLETGLEVTG